MIVYILNVYTFNVYTLNIYTLNGALVYITYLFFIVKRNYLIIHKNENENENENEKKKYNKLLNSHKN